MKLIRRILQRTVVGSVIMSDRSDHEWEPPGGVLIIGPWRRQPTEENRVQHHLVPTRRRG